MWIKKFQAPTLQEAVAKVKAELGPDAVILHTAHVKTGGLLGLFASRVVEVTAAVERHPDEPGARIAAPPGGAGARTGTGGGVERTAVGVAPDDPAGQTRSGGTVAGASSNLPQAPVGWPAVAAEAYRQAIAEGAGAPPPSNAVAVTAAPVAVLPASFSVPVEPTSMPVRRFDPRLAHDLERLATDLIEVGVGEETAYDLVHRVGLRLSSDPEPSAAKARRMAAQLVEQDLKELGRPNSAGRRVIALVGPTGVGKTTTLAKLAAHYVLQRGKRVALIAADTYRVAAVDQLRTYAEILGIPIEVVYEAEEIPGALARCGSAEMILVDTAGRSHRNAAHMDELRRYLTALRADEVYLVLSLTSSERDARAMVEGYWPYGFDRFLFTKWDESSSPGLIYHLAHRYRRPLSYVTTGQSVPEDIVEANPARIAEAIVSGAVGGLL
jgi:flagellar biosynthesis protein FlhF